MHNFIITMKPFYLLLFFCCATSNSCTQKCLRAKAQIALVSFLPEETEEVVVKKFEKGSNFRTLIDSFYLNRLTSTYQERNDTLTILASYGLDNGLFSKYDYEVFMPRNHRLYQINEITETTESMNVGLSCTKEACSNAIRSYNINGQLRDGNAELVFYLRK